MVHVLEASREKGWMHEEMTFLRKLGANWTGLEPIESLCLANALRHRKRTHRVESLQTNVLVNWQDLMKKAMDYLPR